MDTKLCGSCKTTKPVDQMRVDRGKPGAVCLDCNREKSRAWRLANPERHKAKLREIYYRDPSKARRSALKKKYGLSWDQYQSMISSQSGACGICGKPPSDGILRVDHNHETGVVRGLLCDTCNRAIGLLKDCQRVLRSAADYVESSGALKFRGSSGTVTTIAPA